MILQNHENKLLILCSLTFDFIRFKRWSVKFIEWWPQPQDQQGFGNICRTSKPENIAGPHNQKFPRIWEGSKVGNFGIYFLSYKNSWQLNGHEIIDQGVKVVKWVTCHISIPSTWVWLRPRPSTNPHYNDHLSECASSEPDLLSVL